MSAYNLENVLVFVKLSIGRRKYSVWLDETPRQIWSGAGLLLENSGGQVPGSDLEAAGPAARRGKIRGATKYAKSDCMLR